VAKRKALGKGLNALIPDTELSEELSFVDITKVKPSPDQPRKSFNEESIKELSKSIEESGILQPLIVRPENGHYILVVGERRLRAAKIAGLDEVPVIIKDINTKEAMQMALIENIHREDLNPIEEAIAYKQLIEEYDIRQEDVAKLVGRSRPYIANSMRLLTLPDVVKEMLIAGDITTGHARALLALGEEEYIIKTAKRIITDGMTVRMIEDLSREEVDDEDTKPVKRDETDILIESITESLQNILSREVKIFYNRGKGKVVLKYISDEDFNDLLKQLGFKGWR
jgi:ParB family chromosome partitioning protein